jgi:hypothetical protein
MMEMEHPAIVALLCVVLLILVRSSVPYDQRTPLELRLVTLWHSGALAVLTRLRDWLRRS